MHKLADIVTSLWLGIIVLLKELSYEILVFWTYYIISIWNKWKCVNANKWLTLINYKCMKKGSSQQQRTQQISTVNLISVTLLPYGVLIFQYVHCHSFSVRIHAVTMMMKRNKIVVGVEICWQNKQIPAGHMMEEEGHPSNTEVICHRLRDLNTTRPDPL